MTDSLQEWLTDTALRGHQLCRCCPKCPPPPFLSLSLSTKSPFPILSIMVTCFSWWALALWREVKGSHTRAQERRLEVLRIARAERKGCKETQYPSFTFQTGWAQTPPSTSFVYVKPIYSAIKIGLDYIFKVFQRSQ